MITVILAGGYGYRFGNETKKIPKPLVQINNKPLIIYVIETYFKHGVNNFIICTGYKSDKILSYFKNITRLNKNFQIIDKRKNLIQFLYKKKKLNIRFINTGLTTETGGRILKIKKYLLKEDFFGVTYGDVISNINIKKQINYFKKKNRIALLAAVSIPSRFGVLNIKRNNVIQKFFEKPKMSKQKINGGYFIFSKKIFNYIKNSKTILEENPMQKLVKLKQLVAYKHNGFWQPVDSVKDKLQLEKILKKRNV